MKELILKVDRVEEGLAVCYAPDEGGMIDIPLSLELADTVKDGMEITVRFDGESIISVELHKTVDTESAERRARLDRLFGRNKS